MQTIRQELIEITNLTQRDNETENRFVGRLVRAVNDDNVVSMESWESLADATQLWVSGAVDAMNEKKPSPGFPDEVGLGEDTKKNKPPKKAKPAKPTKKEKKDEKDGNSGTPGSGVGVGDVVVPSADTAPAVTPDKEKSEPSGKLKSVEKDQFGLRKGTAGSVAAKMFRQSARMKDVKEETGSNHYNLLRKLEKAGHAVTHDGSLITLTPAK